MFEIFHNTITYLPIQVQVVQLHSITSLGLDTRCKTEYGRDPGIPWKANLWQGMAYPRWS